MEPLEETYFKWLCHKVDSHPHPTPTLTHWTLLKILHSTEFVWMLSGDDNRAEDGMDLRREFLLESGYDEDYLFTTQGCSLLEMLIAFSRRAAFMTDQPVREWFWTFIENIGLAGQNDASRVTEEEIADILYGVVWRTYSYDGNGGLFPLDNPEHDQRDVEIWYQFCEYLVDHEIIE